MITIKEIAKMAGVSSTTVANVIHGRTNKVSKENVERIQRILKEYNYVPKMGLEALTKKKSKLILVVAHMAKPYSHTLLCDPFYGYIIGLLEDYISQAGYYMMLYIKKKDEECDELIKNTAMSWSVAGIISITFPYRSFLRLTSQVDCPLVGIDTYSETGRYDLDTGHHVTLDDRASGKDIANFLIHKGFSNIKVVADVDIGSAKERQLGIQEVMDENQLPFHLEEDFVHINPDKPESFTQLDKFFPLAGKHCVFCCNSDQFAFNVINYLSKHGFRVPEDFSVFGFDDNVYATLSVPPLTTIHQDLELKARTTFELLKKLIDGETVPEQVTYLPLEIVERNSIKQL